jgi:hypothetical protein
MTNKEIMEYSALRAGCERALELLQDPDASEFDAWKVMDYLKIVLDEKT